MTRARLPNRRPNVTDVMQVDDAQGQRLMELAMTVGFDPGSGDAKEVFLSCDHQSGSAMVLILDDVGVLLSRLLQHGDTPEAIARGLGRLGDYPSITGVARDATSPPASIVGKVADRLAEIATGGSPPPEPVLGPGKARTRGQGARSWVSPGRSWSWTCCGGTGWGKTRRRSRRSCKKTSG